MNTLLRISMFLVAIGTLGLAIIFGFNYTENTLVVGVTTTIAVAGYVLLIVYSTLLVVKKIRAGK